MFFNTVSINGSFPMMNLYYYYYNNGKNLKKITPYFINHSLIKIELATTVTEEIIEPLIIQKKITEDNI